MVPHQSKRIWISDTTLRDGEQAPGVVFSLQEKRTIAEMLAEAGIDELEAGTPAMGRTERRAIEEVRDLNLPCRLTCWCRAVRRDIQLAAQCGTGSIHISFPVSSIHLNSMKKNEARILEMLEAHVRIARRDFDRVSVGAQDAMRANPDFLETFIQQARSGGADRVRIADTVGIATPGAVFRIFDRLSRISDIELEFHGHNDLGMATANAVAAAEAGADGLSVTINGLGERAGNAPLEEVSAALAFASGRNCNVRTTRLMGICAYVAKASRRPIPVGKPITGAGVFQHESGIHCDGLLKDPRTYEAFPSEAVGGGKTRFVIGKHSGTNIIRHILRKSGIAIGRDQAERLLEAVRTAAAVKGMSLSTEELLILYDRTCRPESALVGEWIAPETERLPRHAEAV